MIFQLRTTEGRDLDGNLYRHITRIERQTALGIQLAIVHITEKGERTKRYWLPKSRVFVDDVTPGENIDMMSAKKIEIPEWLWERRNESR